MKIAVVTNYGDDRRALAEYGFQLVRGLRQTTQADREITVLAALPYTGKENGVLRPWHYGSVRLPLQIRAALRKIRPDVVVFNTLFTSWGSNLANFLGLCTPWLVKRAGFRSVTLLHHLPQTMNIAGAGYRFTPVHRMAVHVACKALAASGTVCFLSERDATYFAKHFRPCEVELLPHSITGEAIWQPLPAETEVLTFGRWGRSKNPEPVIHAFRAIKPNARLIVAGMSSHTCHGFVDRLRRCYEAEDVVFAGYVPEDAVAATFHRASLVVFPYTENTGVSAVFYQACQYGRVPVMTDLPMFRTLAASLGINAYFYSTEEELGKLLHQLLGQRDRLERQGRQNLERVQRLTVDRVGGRLRHVLRKMLNGHPQELRGTNALH